MTVLVVDDSLMVRKGIASIMRSLDHKVLLASDGKEAIEIYMEEKPDLVTMDMAMPVVSGMDALAEILTIDANAQIVMLTADGHKDLVLEAIQKGAIGYILKPVTVLKIENIVNKLGSIKESKSENIDFE